MLLLTDDDPDMFKRMDFLMDGNTEDLRDEDSFAREFTCIINDRMGFDMTQDQVRMSTSFSFYIDQVFTLMLKIARLMGIKRTNACTLANVGYPGAAAVYPVYNLMNSFCRLGVQTAIFEVANFKISLTSGAIQGVPLMTSRIEWCVEPKILSKKVPKSQRDTCLHGMANQRGSTRFSNIGNLCADVTDAWIHLNLAPTSVA